MITVVPRIGGRKGVGRGAVGQGGGPGVARSLRYGDAARAGHGGRTARGQAGQGQHHRTAAKQSVRGWGEFQRGTDFIHADGAIRCRTVVVPIPSVSGGEGVGRAASGQLRRPGIAAPLRHGNAGFGTGHTG